MRFFLSRVTLGVALTLWTASAGAKDRVMIVGAHPDDLIACLGFCHLAKDVYELHVVDLTHGERGLGTAGFEDGSTKKIRTKEEEAVCASIGATLHWMDEIDGEAHANKDVCDRLARLMRQLNPRAVIAMWPIDVHSDHVMAGAAALRAVTAAGLTPEIWFMQEEYQSKAFAYDVLVDITDVHDKMVESLRLYASQSHDGVTELRRCTAASFYGMQSSHFYGGKAEAYKSFVPILQGQRTIFTDLPAPTHKWRCQGVRLPESVGR